MNASRLQHIIHNPDSIDAQTALELQAIASDLPWFSTPRTLLARYYKSKNDYRETDSLHHAALRVQDRRWLYHFLHDSSGTLVEATVSEPIQANATSNQVAPAGIPPANTDEANKPHFEPVEASSSDEHTETQATPSTLSQEQEAQVEAAVNKTFSFSPADSAPSPAIDTAKDTYTLEEHFESDTVPAEPLDFFGWLNQANPEEEVGSSDRNPANSTLEQPQQGPTDDALTGTPSQQAAIEVPDYNLDHFDQPEQEEPEEPKFLDLAARQALIDKFITTNPSISRPKKEFYNPEVAMKRAEEFDASVCSETLAGLFRKQQAWDKALACYARLQLKFPEKSAYFAALITEVENEKRNHES